MRTFILLCFVALIGGCGGTPIMTIPARPVHSPVPVAGKDFSTVTFEKAIAAIKRGTVIAHFPSNRMGMHAPYCNSTYPQDSHIEWDGGTKFMSGWDGEMAEVFYGVMKDLGYRVAGDPAKPYGKQEDHFSADYSVTAKILEIRGNLCESHDRWDELPQGTFAGEFYLDVEWSVYDTISREVVLTVRTEGYRKRKDPMKQGVMRTFLDAYASAAKGLASDERYVRLMTGANPKILHENEENKYPEMELEGSGAYQSGIERNLDAILRSVVTIRHGDTHGSGFVVSKNGYIITCRHVVANAAKVAVVFGSGMQVSGTVVRSNKMRDAALIKIDATGLTPLPVNPEPGLKRLDPVVAIGSPLDPDLKGTVTKGVVSAFRKDEKDGLDYIQSDVDTSAGNSGGPLLDANGNVIGICVAGYGKDGLSAGLNLFIPIADALKYLNIRIAR